MGRLQLFTESTVAAVLPVATHPSLRDVARLLRLWCAVFLANVAGTLIIAFLISRQIVVGSGEAWLLWLSGHASFLGAAGKLILPALLGNIVGGAGLFAVLAHGQVRGEIQPRRDLR